MIKTMRKTVFAILLYMLLPLTSMTAQTYSSLWKQVENAERKDLPQTQIEILEQIVQKSEKEKAYGQLLKACVKKLNIKALVSPDSLQIAVKEIEQKESNTKDVVLKSIYDVTLYRIYSQAGNQLSDKSVQQAKHYQQEAMLHPQELAKAKADGYLPFVVNGVDSKYFNNDMLSVIGYETGIFRPLVDYYYKQGNLKATCLAGLALANSMPNKQGEDYRKSRQIQRLDSLIKVFGNLDVAGEVAVERYNYMCGCKNVTEEDKISYIHYALDKWGGWQRCNELRNAEKELTQSFYSYTIPSNVSLPDSGQTVSFKEMRNIKQLTLRIYRTTLDGETRLDPMNNNDYQKIRRSMVELPQYTQEKTFVGNPDYHSFSDSLKIAALPVGVYLIEVETNPSTTICRKLYFVSDIKILALPLPNNEVRYAVVNATSGQPISGAKIKLYTDPTDKGKIITLTTNAKGEAIYTSKNKEKPYRIFAYTEKDKYYPNPNSRGGYYFKGRDYFSDQTRVLTDRSIYRPGQTVHVTAIVYKNKDRVSHEAVCNKNIKFVLRNTNAESIAETNATTDNYGTCSAEFTLPQEGLTGRYSLVVNGCFKSINVEEYKRPTFQVEFPEINEKYQSGDTLLIKGKATTYAGIPVQGAKVKYQVTRKTALWWYKYLNDRSNASTIFEQETTTDNNGTFVVEMPLSIPEEEDSKTAKFYNFSVNADVTDIAGETHNGQCSIPLGSRSVVLTSDIPDLVPSDSLKEINFQLRNAAGLNVNAPVRFYIDKKNEWIEASTTQPYTLKKKLSSGSHHLFAICENDTLDSNFTVFSLDDKKPATFTHEWFYASSKEFTNDGKPVVIQVGSSDKNTHILYSIFAENTIVESGSVNLSNGLINKKFSYKDSYGNGLTLAYAWVKNGEIHKKVFHITRPLPNNKLNMEWTTFRNKLVPGQKEEWTLRITKPDGKPADAQLMATLYDKSLDQIASHKWTFGPMRYVITPSTSWNSSLNYMIVGFGDKAINYLTPRSLNFSHFDIDLNGFGWQNKVFTLGSGRPTNIRLRGLAASNIALPEKAMAKMFYGVDTSAAIKGLSNSASLDDADSGENQNEPNVQLRENLNETAFFYPALQTDKDGKVIMKFTLPESITTWKFLGLAHTQDMNYGNIEEEVVARKEVMVQPNVPRFVRTGDQATINARIINMGEKDVNGTARLELSDPETSKVVYTKSIAFNVAKAQTTSVSFDYQPNGDISLLVCKVTVNGRNFSDGEQHYLPVLPNRERVTVSVPFTQQQPGVKHIDINKLFPVGTKNQRLTVEYTNNPAWLMIQALPYISEVHTDNAMDQCATLYANALGYALQAQSPRIKTVFEQWKREQGTETSLQSNLRKNQELKDIVLDETPWISEANSEKEQKMRLANFFDISNMQNRLAIANQKLSQLQNENGSWSWWKGMQGNQYMTVSIAEMLVRLNAMIGTQEETKEMLNKAFSYMDDEIVKQVERMKEAEKKSHHSWTLSSTDLQYLYLRSLDGRKASAQVKEANDYLIQLLKKDIKGQTIYEKALSAIILAKHGETTKSREYVKSLKQYSVYTEEAGRYYDTPRATYSWYDYKIPTEVAAIEAIKYITPNDQQTVDEMRRWLLHEKHTQTWNTTINSMNAIYAFLSGNTSILEHQESTKLAVDGKAIEMPQATAGIGYVKVAIDSPNGKDFTAEKTSTGTSWGAVYAQFLQKTELIEQSNSELSIKREIICEQGDLKVGNKIKIRLTIENKRDLDFVQIKDRRAACMEPVKQLSGYYNGYYCTPKDNATYYYFDILPKGKHVIETEYYIDRTGNYETGICTAECAYAPEFRTTAKSEKIVVNK